MSKTQLFALSIAVSLGVWMLFTWPLPRYVGQGIPMSHSGGQEGPVRYMEPGDHLQLLYHFWLFSDMLTGETPWMYNPYEFNTGDEEARYAPDPYYAPFSWIYAALAPFSSRAFAYNMAGFVSIWLTYLLTCLLVRRYVRSEFIAASLSVLAIILPYRWFSLLGGSPTGFAMAMTPLLLWGLDRAVRDRSIAGGIWAGIAIMFSFTSDLHVFFFNVLLTPAWCVVTFIARQGMDWRSVAAYRRIALPLLPVAVTVLAALLYSRSVESGLAETNMAEGRAIREVMTFSPQRDGFLSRQEHHVSGQIYLGYPLVLLLLAGACFGGVRLLRQRPRPWWDAALYAALMLGVALIALLALGPHGPRGAKVFMRAREWIPQYDMIRQTGKIFAILPPILALLSAMAVAEIVRAAPRRPVLIAVALVPLLLIGGDYAVRIHPPVCLLTNHEAAYAAVAEDAAQRDIRPHAFVVTLWPGDAHFASLYQYYCSLYRIRMINGYTPAVSRDYFDNVFMRFQTINQGWMTDEQADELLERGIHYMIVHEDLFPEKVSPFPITYTLKSLYNHPRLRFMTQADSVWAFRILETPEPKEEWMPEWDVFFPTRQHEFEHMRIDNLVRINDEEASNGAFVRLSEPGAYVAVPHTGTPPAPDLHWYVRVRGHGTLLQQILINEEIADEELIVLQQADWHWHRADIPTDAYGHVSIRCTLIDGALDFDMALLGSGLWPTRLEPGESVTFPAALFFHAGHIAADRSTVSFRPLRDRNGVMFYGPKLPFEPGVYRADLDMTSDAPADYNIGMVHVGIERYPSEDVAVPILGERRTHATWTQPVNLPFNVVLVYHSTAALDVHAITFTRLE